MAFFTAASVALYKGMIFVQVVAVSLTSPITPRSMR